MKSLGAFVFTLLLCLPLVSAARADEPDTSTRLTLALRQATLVQSMRASTCFAMGGIDQDRQGALALEHADSYGTTLAALRDGHDWLGLSPARNADDVAAVATAETVWRDFRPAVDQIIAGDLHSVVMRQIMRDADPTVDSATRLSGHFFDTLDMPASGPHIRQAAQLAAHYRMLTQRALGEMCFVLFDLGGAPMRSRLLETLSDIDQSFALLSEGGTDIAPPPSARVSRNLRTAHLFWSKMRPTIVAVQSDTMPDALTVQKMLKLNKSVLKQLDQAVDGYIG
ncbi:hypothetical protein [uncultured Tateyamaria sp.]|uniref:hypothetical protein n=1 Tax=Tateyamaria sp. 1078 TaxID=3417464 RepID=UPI0026191860|nr:hypothetical protein [uncultured Tateyamaria sp.]